MVLANRASLNGALLIALAVTSCDVRRDVQTYFGRVESRIRPPEVAPSRRAPPPQSCVERIAETRALAIRTRLSARVLIPTETMTAPSVTISDVRLIENDILVLDARQGVLAYFRPRVSAPLADHTVIWRRQSGTGQEGGTAAAVAMQQGVRGLGITNPDAGELVLLDYAGQIRSKRWLPVEPVGAVGLAASGKVYLAYTIWGSSRSPELSRQRLLAMIAPDSSSATLLEIDSDDIAPPRFVLPGPNPVSLALSGEIVALLYPAAGVVDLYSESKPLVQIRVCMPGTLDRMYRSQLERASGETRQQRWAALVSDVYFDASGDIFLVGSERFGGPLSR